jgi:hypothetical protein
MRRAGLRVDYDEGSISTPYVQTMKMKMIDSVWTVPVRPSDINLTVRAFHLSLTNTLVVTSQSKPQYIKYHETLFLQGVTKFFIQYDTTKGTHCGIATSQKYTMSRNVRKGRGQNKIPLNQTSENKKTKNDGASGFSTDNDVIVRHIVRQI